MVPFSVKRNASSSSRKGDKSKHAPYVAASGKGLLARNILTTARHNEVSLVEDKALANRLFSTVRVGQIVPSSDFMNVAEILAYVFRLKDKTTV